MTTDLRVASYNIRKCVGLDWKRNPQRVISVINEIEADIIALQEVDRRFGNRKSSLYLDLIENKTDYKLISKPIRELSNGFHGNAILVRKNFEISNIKTLELPSLEPRGAVAVDIKINGISSVRFIGVHLALLSYWRKKQIKQILDSLVDSSPTTVNIVAGDFNEWKQNKKFYDKTISTPFKIIRSGASFHSVKPRVALDKFIVIGEGYKIKNSGVLSSSLSKVASDHLPIWTDISL